MPSSVMTVLSTSKQMASAFASADMALGMLVPWKDLGEGKEDRISDPDGVEELEKDL